MVCDYCARSRLEADLKYLNLAGKPAVGILDTDEKVRAFYERLVEATKDKFKEFERARRASELRARFYFVD
ncbi:hypothetical protein HY498_03685 [Candidatus Woesearchaeota archaeon]|nr:hypothetical protein [Candidatus Woesearchaeota archaeon]